jgi:hypothetical protein
MTNADPNILFLRHEYILHGNQTSVSYYPEGTELAGSDTPVVVTYTDRQRTLTFASTDVDSTAFSAAGASLGTAVTVDITGITFTGGPRTFSTVLIPDMGLDATAQSFKTRAITTVTAATLVEHGPVFGAQQKYSTETLEGTGRTFVIAGPTGPYGINSDTQA